MEASQLDDFFRHLGLSILKRRRELGMSQGDLAKAAGIHRTYVSDVENGKRNFSIGTLYSIAHSLKIPVQKLIDLGDADVKLPPPRE
jgi:transcriptional regulator with XRE-family HTH domain